MILSTKQKMTVPPQDLREECRHNIQTIHIYIQAEAHRIGISRQRTAD